MGLLRLREKDLLWQEVEGEIIMLDSAKSRYVAANRAGAALWDALARGTDREELVRLLTDRFEVDEASARRDVDTFLEQLRDEGLLER